MTHFLLRQSAEMYSASSVIPTWWLGSSLWPAGWVFCLPPPLPLPPPPPPTRDWGSKKVSKTISALLLLLLHTFLALVTYIHKLDTPTPPHPPLILQLFCDYFLTWIKGAFSCVVYFSSPYETVSPIILKILVHLYFFLNLRLFIQWFFLFSRSLKGAKVWDFGWVYAKIRFA